jgi:arylsulfatase A-like enzyme
MGHYAVPPDVPMLAERLRAEGYATYAVLGNKLLEQPEGILRGFDASVVFHSAVTVRRGPMAQVPFLQEAVARLVPGLAPARAADTTRPIGALGSRFASRHSDRPYFLWLHYMDPHSPWDPPEPYRTMHGNWPIVDPSDAQWGGPQFVANTHQLELDETARAYVRSLYEGEIAYVDASIGDVIRAIGRGRDQSNTLVCVTSDHGEEFWDHGQVTHGQSLYEELVRVPLILSGAGIPVARVEGVTSHLDVMPTLADALGVPVPAGWRGKSILPMLRGEDGAAASAVFAQGTYIVAPEPLRMMLRGPRKFIEGLESRDMRVFDLTEDRLEQNALVGVDALKHDAVEAMDAWWGSFPARVESLGSEAETGASDMFEQLRSLGYLD